MGVLQSGQRFIDKLAKTLQHPARLKEAYQKFKVGSAHIFIFIIYNFNLFDQKVAGICWSKNKWLITVPGAKHKVKRATFSGALTVLRGPCI